jgi:hypothetical protein
MSAQVTDAQKALRARFGVHPEAVDLGAKVGISRSVREGRVPSNGMRQPPEEGTTGWFIWAEEELSDEPDFFLPCSMSTARFPATWVSMVRR